MDAILSSLREGRKVRLVAFGSSNTERRIHGLHWFDWLDLGLKQAYGRVHHCINAGLGGDTTRGLLQRFDEDVALYQPHVVFVTIGGNDANPLTGIGAEEYEHSLRQIVARVRALGARVVLQTYYGADIERMAVEHGAAFLRFMDIVRAVAETTGSPLIDHHRRWEPLRQRHVEAYRRLMIDALHVNPLGNMVMGLDLIRRFEARLEEAQTAFCAEGLRYQGWMDELASDSGSGE